MKNKIFSAVLLTGSLVLAVPTQGFAASLGLTTAAPTIEASSASIAYLKFGSDGDLSTFDATVDLTNGVSPAAPASIGFGVGFSLADPTVGATGGFDIFDANGSFLGGDLMAVGFLEDVIELQFGNLVGAGAGSFGASVLARIAFADPLGANPFASLVDGSSYAASITLSNIAAVRSVPVPATLPLLLTALIGLGCGERWRRQG